MRRTRSAAVLAAIGLAATGTPVHATGATAPIPTDPAPESTEAWEAEWEALIAAAQEEGEVSFVNGPSFAEDLAVLEAFAERFDLELQNLGGPTDETAARVAAERDQGLYNYDIANLGNSGTATFIESGFVAELMPLLFHPEAVDRSSGWRFDYFPWFDETEKYCTYMALAAGVNHVEVYYNTENVSHEEIDAVASYQDFLDPSWKGRIVIGNLADGEQSHSRTIAWMEFGEDWFDTLLRDQDVTVLAYGSGRELADGLARGDWDVAIFPPGLEELGDVIDDGLPVALLDRTLAEGVPAFGSQRLCVIDHPANPNAAQLFANWILTREGQTVFNETTQRIDRVSLRNDVPQGNVPDDLWQRANDAVTFQDVNTLEFRQADEESLAFLEDLFAELGIVPGG